MTSPIENYQAPPLLVQNSGSCDDIVVETNHRTASDTVVQVSRDVTHRISSTASGGGNGIRLNAVESRQIPIHPKLYRAAEEGDVELLEKFLQYQDSQQLNGLNPLQGVTFGGNTVLHIAATSSGDLTWQQKGDYVELAKAVYIRNKQLLMTCNKLKETPLHCAVKAGNYTMISLLISFAEHEHQVGDETLLRARSLHGETALHEAVRTGHRDIVNKLILSEPCLTGIVDADGVSPLYLAAMMNALDIVQIFTREESSTVSCAGPKGQTALHAAVLEHTGITHALLEWNKSLAIKVDDLESTPLHCAASVGNLATVKLLLQYETSAVYMADKDGLYPIHIAAKCGRALVVKELIEQFRDSDELLDKEGRNFLHLAIKSRKGNIISNIHQNRTFLRMLNARDYQGNTSLHLAGQNGGYHIVRFLISKKNVCATTMNREGLTPVDLAIKEVDQGFIKFVLSTKFNILRCLMWTGALPSPGRFDHFGDDLKLTSKDNKKAVQKLESVTRVLGIISVLFSTVIFAAIFTMPGGYIADDHVNGGTPILSRKYAFKAFIIANLLAFLLSFLATAWLCFAGAANVDIEFHTVYLKLSVGTLQIAGKATVYAFALAIYAVLYKVNLQISILVLAVSFGIVPFSNLAHHGALLLASPIVKRVGWMALLKSHFCPSTQSWISGVFWIGRKFSALVLYNVVVNISLFSLIFLLALL